MMRALRSGLEAQFEGCETSVRPFFASLKLLHEKAQARRGLLVHADRGSQYPSEAFTSLLDRAQAIASLSRPGNSYDNALAESGWRTLKIELPPRGA